jgi:SAM-dependent methyltransferase
MTPPTWWLDELAHAGDEHLDPGHVAGYEAKAGYDPRPDVELLITLGLDHRSTLIDAGAGTGAFTRAVAPHAGRVIAIDVSPAMVEVLQETVRSAGLGNVDVVRAGFLSYEHDGPPVDFAFSRNALHQVPDFWKGIGLHRLATMLRPGGILRLHDLIYDIDPAEAFEFMPAWFAGAVDDHRRGWTPAELADHVRLEHSTYRFCFEALVAHAGFDVVDVSFRRRAYGAYTLRRR